MCGKTRTALGGGIRRCRNSGVGETEIRGVFQEIVLFTLYQEKKSIRVKNATIAFLTRIDFFSSFSIKASIFREK